MGAGQERVRRRDQQSEGGAPFAALLPQFASGEGSGTAAQLGMLGAAYLAVEFFVGLGYVAVGAAIGSISLLISVARLDSTATRARVGVAGRGAVLAGSGAQV
jgi:threonine/homoserine/homoserine lactone efflux protein